MMPRLPRLPLPAAALLGLLLAATAPAGAFETGAKAAVVMDHRTGLVMFEKDADRRIPPASMSKLMTAYMIFDRLKRGRLKLDDEITVSERSWKMGGSQMFLKVGDRVKVEDLIRGIIIQSGNDACVAMAEALSGSEEGFAREMNEKAKELGLSNSSFANSTGLDAPDHLMSVRDLAKLGRAIITEFPEYFKYYGEKEFSYRDIKQPNRNPLLQAGVPGVDGMKTGYTEEAGYGLVATAKREDRRVITVLAGLEKLGQRKGEAERLLEFGFREFEEYRLFGGGEAVAEADVWLGAGPKVPLVPAETVGVTLPREKRKDLVVKLRYDSPVPAPVAAGQQLGHLEISAPGMETYTVPLVAGQEVPKAGVLGRLTGALTYLVLGAAG
jgi:D-alanyl-D-alanine carboxypeptidase (penicillin-binding protein 5/6)